MEKRFVLFLVMSFGVLLGYALLKATFAPPAPDPIEGQVVQEEPEDADQAAGADDDNQVEGEPDSASDSKPVSEQTETEPAEEAPEIAAEPGDETTDGVVREWISAGSYNPKHGESPLLVTWSNRGATIERIELTIRTEKGDVRYQSLDQTSGYLGHLALTEQDGGLRVNVVGRDTPAAMAMASGSSPPGLLVGDMIRQVNDVEVSSNSAFEELLEETRPGDAITLTVDRGTTDAKETLTFDVTLGVRPLQMIRPETLTGEEFASHPLSYLVSIVQLNDMQAKPDETELEAVPSLRRGIWKFKMLNEPAPGVEFTFMIDSDEIEGLDAPIEVVKRFSLGRPTDDPVEEAVLPFHIDFDLEFRNRGDNPVKIAYRFDGPNGLPTEGWWYSNKIHPKMFQSAGARDVICNTEGEGQKLEGCSAIYKNAKKRPKSPQTVLFASGGDDDDLDRTVRYIGVDTQYFVASAIPDEPTLFDRGAAEALNDVEKMPKGRTRKTNVSSYLVSTPITLAPGESHVQGFRLYSGPKVPEILAAYGLGDCIYYGWFGGVSRLLAKVLHFFFSITANYGIAIILLTVLVRSCMFPLSRKAAKNAAMMQELAPEMKKIAEKYKNDMEKRSKAQQDLFRKHSYNPFGGCWMMFLQLPIFIGLYRTLSVDLELRQAPLIPGLSWCSNLAGPDKLFYWENPFLGLFTETGMLGPYFNILPIFTVALFLVHQKLFTPPATDEQTRMQMQMMKYMTLFIGVMFFKVAAGLCLYFIASSLWGIGERKLIPKPKAKLSDDDPKGGGAEGGRGGNRPAKPKIPPTGGSNGSTKKPAARQKKRNRRR